MDEKPKRTPQSNAHSGPCPICSESSYTWGYPSSEGGLWFKADDSFPMGWGEGLAARKCDNCGNIQLFSKEHGF